MPTADYGKHERLRRNARLALVAEILYDVEARCAAMSPDTEPDAYEIAHALMEQELERVEEVFESAVLVMSSDRDAGEPLIPWRVAIDNAREWALRRPFKEDRLPVPLPGQLRLPSAPEIASSAPLTGQNGSANM